MSTFSAVRLESIMYNVQTILSATLTSSQVSHYFQVSRVVRIRFLVTLFCPRSPTLSLLFFRYYWYIPSLLLYLNSLEPYFLGTCPYALNFIVSFTNNWSSFLLLLPCLFVALLTASIQSLMLCSPSSGFCTFVGRNKISFLRSTPISVLLSFSTSSMNVAIFSGPYIYITLVLLCFHSWCRLIITLTIVLLITSLLSWFWSPSFFLCSFIHHSWTPSILFDVLPCVRLVQPILLLAFTRSQAYPFLHWISWLLLHSLKYYWYLHTHQHFASPLSLHQGSQTAVLDSSFH